MPLTRLKTFLDSRGGAAPFRDFMDAALYDPDFGYYSRHVATVGRGGDFATAATLSPDLGRAVAAWLVDQWNLRPGRRGGHVIEAGPGEGSLAEAVLDSLGWWRRRKVRLHLVERSPVLRRLQQERLRRFRNVSWHDSMAAALAAANGHADIFSNELADAFPVTLLQWDGGAWHEVWLERTASGSLAETLRPLPPLPPATALHWPPETIPDGQRLEIGTGFHAWLNSWLGEWKSGSLLTIDYGGRGPEIWSRRPAGTVRAYLQQQLRQGLEIYEHMGRQDLTADVNFDDLICWGESAGLSTVRLELQHEFLAGQIAQGTPAAVAAFLADTSGAGTAFLVLTQRRP